MSMKIYTRTGDEGETGLFGGGRVAKDHPRVAAYGDVDELSSAIGVARATQPVQFFDELLETVQRDLFAIGGHLATPDPEKVAAALVKAALSTERVTQFEQVMDAARSSCRGARRRPRRSTSRAPCAAARSAASSAWRTSRRYRRCSWSTSTGSPICSSPWRAWPTTATARAT
jgi:cob(I)alamin adenosyltransferase